MSPVLTRIIGILLFAVVTAVLFAIGMVKERDKQQTLSGKLFLKGESAVKKALSKNGKMTRVEIEKCVTGLKAGLFYSKEKAVVSNPVTFTKDLLDQMEQRHIIVQVTEKGKKYYQLAYDAQKEQEPS